MSSNTLKVVVTSGLIALGAGSVGIGSVAAHQGFDRDQHHSMQAVKLGRSELKELWDEVRQERHQRRLIELTRRIDEAILEGTLTETQKTALISKLESMHQERMAQPTKYPQPGAKRQEWQRFALEQGIDEAQLWELFGLRRSQSR